MFKTIRRYYRIWAGKSPAVWVGKYCPKVWYGNDYGGFYVCPLVLPTAPIVYSFGIGKDISFDQAMMQQHQAQIFAFDPTPDSIDWVGKQVVGKNFQFLPFGIGAKTGNVDFYLPKNPAYVSGSVLPTLLTDKTNKITVLLKSWTDILAETAHTQIDILKMDIEGAEYDVIPTILEAKIPIKQILVEFHGRVLQHTKTLEMVALMKKYGYEVFGISDRGEEISFIA
jgi:FkbM family methyltransferase